MLLSLLLILADGPISKWETKTPDLAYQSEAGIYDIERCMIDMPKQLVPVAFRQPDRPDEVTLIFPDQYGLSSGRVTLKKVSGGTAVTAWSMPKQRVEVCAPR